MHGPRLLHVEDSVTEARLAAAALRGLGAHIDVATTLLDGLRALQTRRPDAVLLDLGLPDSGGIDTLARVQAAAPGIPIVVATGLEQEGLAGEALAAGADDLVTKGSPTYAFALRQAVGHALERSAVLRALESEHAVLAVAR